MEPQKKDVYLAYVTLSLVLCIGILCVWLIAFLMQ